MPQQKHKAKRVAIDFGTTGTGIARYDKSTEMPCLVPVGWNVTEDSPRTRLPAAMLVTQFEHGVDVAVVGFEDESKFRAEKEREGKVIRSELIAAPKLLLDPNRCKKGQALKDAEYLQEVNVTPWHLYRVYMERILQFVKDNVDIDSIETWCLTVPVIYTTADKPSEEMQDKMTHEMITAARSVINEEYNIDGSLEFESEPVAVMAQLVAQRSLKTQGEIVVMWDAGGSTVDLAAAEVVDHLSAAEVIDHLRAAEGKRQALKFIIAAGASSGTYYMWEELKKACEGEEQTYGFARKAIEAMTEPCDITRTNISEATVRKIMNASYCAAFKETYVMLSKLRRMKYSAPKIIVVGRAPGANSMINAFLVSSLQGILRRVFEGQTLPDIEVPGGLDVGVCRGAALPYNSDPVQAFTEATVAVCYRADGGRGLPKELRGKDNALVVIKNSGVEKLSKQWLSCQVDGAPKKFVVHLHVIVSKRKPYTYEDETNSTLYCYPKAAGLTMNALPINLEGHAKDGDRIEYMISQPDPRKPTAVAIEVKCPNGRVATQCELIKDRERLQLRLVKGRTFQDHDEVLQLAARADGQGDAYDGPDTEPEEGSTSVQLPLHANKRGQENGGKASPPGKSQKRRRLPDRADANR
ncbi:hypothetical protein ISF_09841 [Cordyceps fumosorosea ARSEF 2679]|uniref:Uncharacterized protein n=1 Tax=Cordyceps fumosorosea (strain ARSEF 2679) TaxID=1081104 RepID=A0A167B887_CORFA|nr:hypothetical protein ISF_09841 [Cordyceps fumosorosea ARSEF 2679]OAA39762.1 hypothetical protein ISF_09841 [Cordyceps fumosorosea ARSEF 2679]